MNRGIKWFCTNYTWNFIQTTVHKMWVMYYIGKFVKFAKCFDDDFRWALIRRGVVHDLSKYSNAEAVYFADEIFNLKKIPYGTPEYKTSLEKIRPCLNHHYKHNSHHPEFHANGFAGMSQLDKIELVADWCASSRRQKNGDVYKSIEMNQQRFGYSSEDAAWIASVADVMKGRND